MADRESREQRSDAPASYLPRAMEFVLDARFIAALTLIVAFAFYGSRGTYESTEGRYAECAREMLARREWLEPTLSGQPHWSKPPLVYWAVSAGMRLFGENGYGARLQAAIAHCLTAALVGMLASRLFENGKVARLSALVYATLPFTVFAAWTVSTDALLALFEALAVFSFVAAETAASGRSRWLVRLGYCALGLGFLTKGPAVFVALVPILWSGGRQRSVRWRDPLGIALGIAIGASWYVVMAARHPGLLGHWLGDELRARLATPSAERNPEWYKPLTIFVAPLVFGSLLWSYPWLRDKWSQLRRHGIRSLAPVQPVSRRLAAWFIVPLLAFSLSRSRLPLYVLPICVPLALILARSAYADGSPARLRRCAALAILSAALILAGKSVGSWIESPRDMRRLSAAIDTFSEFDPRAEVLIYRNDDMHGLEFYREGRVRRVSKSGGQSWADLDLPAAVVAMRDDTHGPLLLVAGANRRDELVSAFNAASVSFDETTDTKWLLLRRSR